MAFEASAPDRIPAAEISGDRSPLQGDERILERIQSGNYREAISLCAGDHGAAIGRLAMAMLADQGEAEEVAQETLLAAFDAFPSFRAESTVRAWLMGIARRICAKRLVKRARRERRLELAYNAETDAELPDAALERRRRAAGIRHALEKIKPSDRETLLLRFESGLSYREIGAITGVDESSARKRASRAIAKLREVMKGEQQ